MNEEGLPLMYTSSEGLYPRLDWDLGAQFDGSEGIEEFGLYDPDWYNRILVDLAGRINKALLIEKNETVIIHNHP